VFVGIIHLRAQKRTMPCAQCQACGLGFTPFFQTVDQNVLRPRSMIPLIVWNDIGHILAVFTVVLVLAQIAVIGSMLREGAFQALRMGDQE
jgi:hypothetical protein